MPIVPAQHNGHHRLVIAVVVNQPVLLPNAGRGVVAPEVDAQHFLMRKPDRPMVIVIGGTRMSHPRQRASRRPQ